MSTKSQSQDVTSPDEVARVMSLRDAASFPLSHKLTRLLWRATWGVFAAWTPPQLDPWRRLLLRAFGADIHPTASVRGGAIIWYPANLKMDAYSVLADGVQCYNMTMIRIGARTVVSQRAVLCGGTHDFTIGSRPLITLPIHVQEDCWICSEAFIGPGVDVRAGCVVGARAVITRATEPYGVYAGNPAKRIKDRAFDPSQ